MSLSHSEYKGKDIDEAIALACEALKATRADLEIEIVSAGSAGIFGLGKRKAVIRARRKAAPMGNPETQAAPPAVPESPAPLSVKAKRHHGKTTRREEPRAARKPAPLSATETRHQRARPSSSAEPGPPPTPETIRAIQDLTKNMLGLMGFDLEVSVSHKMEQVLIHIHPDDNVEELVGREGSVLDAIQYLLRKIVAHRFPERLSLSLDAGNYREGRQNELRALALELAHKVKETGKSQTLGALNPAERRIVHVALQDDPGIRSASIGEGLFKKVRIYLPGTARGRRRPVAGPGEEVAAASSSSGSPSDCP